MQELREQYDQHYEGRLIDAFETIVIAEPPLQYDDSCLAASLS